jgi:hypothetical protein
MRQGRVRSLARLLLDAVGASLVVVAVAGAAVAGPARYAQSWDDLSPEQRSRALENYQRYKKLPKNQQRQLDRSYERWQGMDPNQRDRVRRNYESYRELDRQQRKDFGRRYQQWRRDDPGKGR